MPSVNLSKLDTDLQDLLRKTGMYVNEEFNNYSYEDTQFKAENDPFSHVDVHTEELVKEGCEKMIPGCGFVTEEAENQESKNGYVWIIDPIDGTANFTHGIPYFSISVALQYQEETIMGHVYQPYYDHMFVAHKGGGAKLDGKSIQVSNRGKLIQSLLTTGFPANRPEWISEYFKLFSDLHKHAHGVRRLGSAALDLASVAAGRLDGFFEYILSPWDVAAGALLVKEAGGIVNDFRGGDEYLNRKGIIATNGLIHREFLDLVNKRSFPERK